MSPFPSALCVNVCAAIFLVFVLLFGYSSSWYSPSFICPVRSSAGALSVRTSIFQTSITRSRSVGSLPMERYDKSRIALFLWRPCSLTLFPPSKAFSDFLAALFVNVSVLHLKFSGCSSLTFWTLPRFGFQRNDRENVAKVVETWIMRHRDSTTIVMRFNLDFHSKTPFLLTTFLLQQTEGEKSPGSHSTNSCTWLQGLTKHLLTHLHSTVVLSVAEVLCLISKGAGIEQSDCATTESQDCFSPSL
jgi:hypothetical protein